MKRLFTTLILAATTLASFAQEKITFKLNPELDKATSYQVVNKMDVEGPQTVIMDMTMYMDLTYSKLSDTTLKVSSKFTKAKVDMDAGMMTMSYDSSVEPEDEMQKMLAAQFAPILENTLSYTMNLSGQIKEVDFPNVNDQLFDKSSLSTYGATYPQHPIAIGDSWQSQAATSKLGISSKASYTLKEKTAEGYIVDYNVDIFDDAENQIGNATGFFTVDPVKFTTVSSSTQTTIEMQGTKVTTTTDMKIAQ